MTVRAADPVASVRIDDQLLSDIPEPQVFASTGPTRVRFVGIGGTGVVTVAQILGVAAWLDGYSVRGVDQTGLSQKAGAVVSDVKFAPEPFESPSALGIAECDVYVACDLLAGTDTGRLEVMSPGRTVAIMNGRVAPTGTDATEQHRVVLDGRQLAVTVADRARDAQVVDAHGLAETLLGSEQYANVVLLGAAYQSGRIPVSARAIEHAIHLNATAVTSNVRAFRVGRLAVQNPEVLEDLGRPAGPTEDVALAPELRALIEPLAARSTELETVLVRSVSELTEYQDRRYARRYVDAVGEVQRTESAIVGTDAVTVAFARSLYKLMAYKDEYEVARLALDPQFRASLRAAYGTGARVSWHLHPPVLRALGVKRKLTLGPWFGPILQLLRTSRRLRGTPFDPFGRSRVRRLERSLRDDYQSLALGAVRDHLVDHYEDVLALVELPGIVRGYEGVKLANVERYEAELAVIRARLASGPVRDRGPDPVTGGN